MTVQEIEQVYLEGLKKKKIILGILLLQPKTGDTSMTITAEVTQNISIFGRNHAEMAPAFAVLSTKGDGGGWNDSSGG